MPEDKGFDSVMLYFLIPAGLMVVVIITGVLLFKYFPSIPNDTVSARTIVSDE